ncbi:MAG: hypothetical protein Q8Q07_01365 [Dehalococcoidales bacterium]|nr:hypothetical protein [Dehalococcoidales bacterium]
MEKAFVVSLVVGLIPTVALTAMAILQLGNTKLGGKLFMFQAGYTLLLLLATILFFVLKKEDITKGLLVSFVIGLVVLLIRVGWGV